MTLRMKIKAWPRVRFGHTPRLMLIAGLVGVGVGVGAYLLIETMELVQDAASVISNLPGMSRAWVFIVIPIGLLLAWLTTSRFSPEATGHGVPQILAALTVRAGKIRGRVAPVKIVATALTLGSGGSAGREGPIAQVGASLGSTAGRWVKLGESDIRSLVAAGTAAGIAATFNAPIAGMFFAMEVILGSFSVAHVGTVAVAAVAGAVVSHGLLGTALTFSVPAYPLGDARELVLYAGLGLLAVAIGYVFLRTLNWWDVIPNRLPTWIRPAALALVVATVGFAAPEVLGTGQAFIEGLLQGELTLVWWALIILAVAKSVATAATFGAGGSGGIFMPSLFIGASVGAGFASLIAPYWTISPISSGAFALVGMAAGFAAVARAPLTAILIVFETTGDYGLVLPLIIVTAIATILGNRIHPESAYTMQLSKMGIQVSHRGEIDLLDTVKVGDVTSGDVLRVRPDVTLGEVQGLLDRHRLHGLPVVEGQDRLVGVIATTDIVRAGGPSDQVLVGSVMTPRPATVTPETLVSEAIERMAVLGVGRLPVVSEHAPDLLIGIFRREDAVNAYHQALADTTRERVSGDRFRERTSSDAEFFRVEVPANSVADGRPIKEVPWPEGCLLVSVHRGPEVFVAKGEIVLQKGDVITAFAVEAGRRRLEERLAISADDTGETEAVPVL